MSREKSTQLRTVECLKLCTKYKYVIANQRAHWRGNFTFQVSTKLT